MIFHCNNLFPLSCCIALLLSVNNFSFIRRLHRIHDFVIAEYEGIQISFDPAYSKKAVCPTHKHSDKYSRTPKGNRPFIRKQAAGQSGRKEKRPGQKRPGHVRKVIQVDDISVHHKDSQKSNHKHRIDGHGNTVKPYFLAKQYHKQKYNRCNCNLRAKYLDDLLGKGEKEKAEKIFTEYLENVQKLHSKKPFTITEEFKNVFGDVPMPGGLTCTDVTNIDMICDNVVMTSPYTLLDYEWTFEFPVPCEFVLYRIIHYYIQTHKVREVLNAAGFYEKFGISEVMRTSFSRMESGFQVYITGMHVPMREMYATMTPGVEYLSLSNLGPLQVYFAEQRGMYSEASSVKRPIMAGKVKCTLNLPKSCRFIRIDPGDHPCTVHLAAIRFDRMPASLDGVLTPEGTICGSWAFLSRFDPCIVDIEVPEGAKNLTLNLEIDEAKEDMLNEICSLEVRSHSLKGVLGERAREAVGRLKNGWESSAKKGK